VFKILLSEDIRSSNTEFEESFKDCKPNQNFWLKLANSFVFCGVRNVFNIICLRTIHSCQGAMCKWKILPTIHHNHFLVTKMFAKKKSAATRNFLELSLRVFRNFDSFFEDEIVFFF
jgi:hypothetical protein